MGNNVGEQFLLTGKTIIITGAGGLLGRQHCLAVAEAGGIPILLEFDASKLESASGELSRLGYRHLAFVADITKEAELISIANQIVIQFRQIDGLVNNAAINPKVEDGGKNLSRLENLPLIQWNMELEVGLTGAMLCSRVFGSKMNNQHSGGVIVNIASDLGLIAPDQRLYTIDGLSEKEQPVKPVTYSVIKHGLIGLTRYLATYFNNVRCNALSPSGIQTNRPESFVTKLTALIPMQRMAMPDEYKAALVFLLTDASKYMTGQNIVVDGGRTVW